MSLGGRANMVDSSDDGTTPLVTACHQSHTEIVAALIAAGAKVNQA